MWGEGLAVARRPVVHVRNQHQRTVVRKFLWRDPGGGAAGQRWPWSVAVASVIIVADDKAVFLFLEGTLGLLTQEKVGDARAAYQLARAQVFDHGVAGDLAEHGQMVVIPRFGLVRRAAGDGLFVVVAE